MSSHCSLSFSVRRALTLAIGVGICTVSIAHPLSPRQFVANDVIGLPGDSYVGFLGLDITPDGQQVYAVAGVESAIVGFNRDATTGALTVKQLLQEDITNRTGIHNGDDVVVSADGRFAFVAGLEPGFGEPYADGSPATTMSAISVFERDATTGGLTPLQVLKMTSSHPYKLMISGSGCDIHLTGVNVRTIGVFRCAANGVISKIQGINNPAPTVPTQHNLDSSEASAMTPNQQHVYVSARVGANDNTGAIYHFARDAASGQLTYVDQVNYVSVEDGLYKARDLKVSPDGAFLYSVSDAATSDVIKTFSIGAAGSLTYVSTFALDVPQAYPDRLWWPNSIAISANGRLMYVTDNVSNSLLVFGRNLTTGAVEYYGAEVQSQNGVGSMVSPERVKLSPDNRFAYVSGSYGMAVFNTYAALKLTSTPSVTSVVAGSEVTYTLRVTNEEGAIAHGTTLTFTPPVGVDVRSVKPATATTSCAQSSGVVTCNIADLDLRAAEDVSITVASPTAIGPFAVEAHVTAYEVDNDSANNTATSTVTTATAAAGSSTPAPTTSDPVVTTTASATKKGGGGSLDWLVLGALGVLPWLRRRHVRL